jgi:hypothetical protein
MDVRAASIKPAQLPAEPVRRKSVVGRVMLAVFLLLLGALSTIAISWGLAFQTELADQPALSGQGFDGPRSWRVQGWGGFGSIRLHSIRDLPAWSVLQAAGPPDTRGQGDIVTAWASATTDGQKEWLLLDYARAVTPTKIDVHETYNPGALEKVSVFDEGGAETVVWQGNDPTPPGSGRGISSVPVSVSFKTSRVKIYIDSPRVAGWNEIDTVGLHDDGGNILWPVMVDASSSYGRVPSASAMAGPESFLPDWCALLKPGKAMSEGRANSEERMIEARGWPMLAMWGERAQVQVGGQTGGNAAPSPGSLLLLSEDGAVAPTSGSLVSPGSGALPAMRATGGLLLRSPVVTSSASGLAPMLPLRPIWRGFLIDTLMLAILYRVIYLVLAVPRRFVMEISRMRRGCCLKCGYQLGFDFRAGCPECGWRRSAHEHRLD